MSSQREGQTDRDSSKQANKQANKQTGGGVLASWGIFRIFKGFFSFSFKCRLKIQGQIGAFVCLSLPHRLLLLSVCLRRKVASCSGDK